MTVLFLAIGCSVGFLLWRYSRQVGLIARKFLAYLVTYIGLTMALAIGIETHLVLPGIGSVGAGAAVGAFVGWLLWMIVGTLGVVPMGIAIGLWSMVSAAMSLSALGSLVGGIGFRTVLVPYVPVALWLPLLVTGYVMHRGNRKLEGANA